jgi:nitrogen PTS system EIIA component
VSNLSSECTFMSPDHEILTLEEVAQYLRVSERTVYEWANKREIPCGKLGTTWRFKRSEIEKWVDQKLGGRPQPPRTSTISLKDVLTLDRVRLLETTAKDEALRQLVDCLATSPLVRNKKELTAEVFEREELMSTGIGFGIGVPHVRLASVDNVVMAVGVSRKGIADYASLDEQPVRIICMVAAHENQHAQYLRTLAAISTLMKQDDVRQAILAATTVEEIYQHLTAETA